MENGNIPETLDNYYILNDDDSKSIEYTLEELAMLKTNEVITKDTLIIRNGEDPRPACTFIDSYHPDIINNSETKNDKELPEELNTFNFGACILFPFWGYSHFPKYKVYWGVFIVIFCFLNPLLKIYKSTLPLPFFELFVVKLSNIIWTIMITIWPIMIIIFLIKGNELAWRNRKFKDIKQFKDIQKKWNIWGYTIFILSFMFIAYILFF